MIADYTNVNNEKVAFVSKRPVKKLMRQNMPDKRSLSERVHHHSSEELLNYITLRKKMIINGPTGVIQQQESSRNHSVQKLGFNLTHRDQDSSLPKDDKTSQFSNHMKETIKAYMINIPPQKVPLTKKESNIMRVSRPRDQKLNTKQPRDSDLATIEKKKMHNKHVTEVFRPLNRSSTAIGTRNPLLSSEAMKWNAFLTPETARQGVNSMYIENKIEEKVPTKIEEDVVNEAIVEHETTGARLEDSSAQEPTMISNFPTYTNNTQLSPQRVKSDETPQRMKKEIAMNEEKKEQEVLMTELEDSLAHSSNSTLREDAYPLVTHKEKSDAEPWRSKGPSEQYKQDIDFSNQELYMRRMSNEQFNELTAKPFSSRKSSKRSSSNMILSRCSGYCESRKTDKESNLMTDGDEKEPVYSSSLRDPKNSVSKSLKNREAGSKEGQSCTDLRREQNLRRKIVEKVVGSKSLNSVAGTNAVSYADKNQSSETIKL